MHYKSGSESNAQVKITTIQEKIERFRGLNMSEMAILCLASSDSDWLQSAVQQSRSNHLTIPYTLLTDVQVFVAVLTRAEKS
jgi:hypothetical protein